MILLVLLRRFKIPYSNLYLASMPGGFFCLCLNLRSIQQKRLILGYLESSNLLRCNKDSIFVWEFKWKSLGISCSQVMQTWNLPAPKVGWPFPKLQKGGHYVCGHKLPYKSGVFPAYNWGWGGVSSFIKVDQWRSQDMPRGGAL